jgi:molybdopterin converting factor small subunit
VRVLAGTRKGAFILTSDEKRQKWDVSGPHFAGWEIYHLKGSPADPDRIYASQTSGWFGQVIQRSDDGGKTWHQPGTPKGEPTTGPDGSPKGESNKFVYDTSAETGKPLTTHQHYDGTQKPWEFKRVWHLEPALKDPNTVYAGIEDAAIFRSTDGGQNWKELSGLRGHGTGPKWQPGAGGMCLHTILLDPRNDKRIFVAISSAGAFRSDDGGETWKVITKGLHSQYIPDPTAEVGHCVHRIAQHRSRPNVLFMQKHWDVLRSDDAGTTGRRSAATCPPTSGSIDVHTHEPETVYVVPIRRLRALPARRQAARLPQPQGRERVGGADGRPPPEGLLRERAARRHVRRFPRHLRRVLRDDGRAGVRLAGRRRPLGPDRARPARCPLRRGADAQMIRVQIPAPLRRLTGAEAEVSLEVTGAVTIDSVLDALEARYPGLKGTIRDHVTRKRRPFVRFFAGKEDLSHDPTDAPLPDAVAQGAELLVILGAIAGG